MSMILHLWVIHACNSWICDARSRRFGVYVWLLWGAHCAARDPLKEQLALARWLTI